MIIDPIYDYVYDYGNCTNDESYIDAYGDGDCDIYYSTNSRYCGLLDDENSSSAFDSCCACQGDNYSGNHFY